MKAIAWPAPAKLNRFLHIVGRRPDGYHLLQTIFQFLDKSDELYFTPRSDGIIEHCNPLPNIPIEQDLTVRAARLLKSHCRSTQGVSISITKRLPIGGGLGGGSSNAATTLVALNHYWQTGLSLQQLAELGLQLGADVPVFVHGCAAWAEGIGEQLYPLETLDQPWFVVLIPPCSVATKKIFNNPALTRDTTAIKIRALITENEGNDCEEVVFQLYPNVANVARLLERYAKTRMSGTGSCLFAAFTDQVSAQTALQRVLVDLQQVVPGTTGFVSQACNKSHLHQCLQQAKMWE